MKQTFICSQQSLRQAAILTAARITQPGALQQNIQQQLTGQPTWTRAIVPQRFVPSVELVSSQTFQITSSNINRSSAANNPNKSSADVQKLSDAGLH